MEKHYRTKYIYSLGRFKGVKLCGTRDACGQPNAAIISSVAHLGANLHFLVVSIHFVDDGREHIYAVRPGGIMVIATINRTWLSYLLTIVGAEYTLRWLPKGTHRWKQFPMPSELNQLLARCGLEVVEKLGVRVNPFTKEFSLTRADFANYMLIGRKSMAS